jgi:hypothetical protein
MSYVTVSPPVLLGARENLNVVTSAGGLIVDGRTSVIVSGLRSRAVLGDQFALPPHVTGGA